jgi:hypothetical protein
MDNLSSIRATIESTYNNLENDRDDVQGKIAASIGNIGVGEAIESGSETSGPWRYEGIGQNTIDSELRYASSKQPTKMTPTLLSGLKAAVFKKKPQHTSKPVLYAPEAVNSRTDERTDTMDDTPFSPLETL